MWPNTFVADTSKSQSQEVGQAVYKKKSWLVLERYPKPPGTGVANQTTTSRGRMAEIGLNSRASKQPLGRVHRERGPQEPLEKQNVVAVTCVATFLGRG